jgi:hypothetical protein
MHDQARLSGLRVRIDCGLGDPFADAVRTYRDRLRDVRPAVALSGGFSHGGHDRDYWRRVLPRELAFAGSTLAG